MMRRSKFQPKFQRCAFLLSVLSVLSVLLVLSVLFVTVQGALPSQAAQRLAAQSLVLQGEMRQGHLVYGKATPGAQILYEGRPTRVDEDGVFLIGFSRDAGPTARLQVIWPDGRREEHTLAIAKRHYDVQRIDGLPPNKVNPPADVIERIRAENRQIGAARLVDSAMNDFRFGWIWPTVGTITGVYGAQRVLNGTPKRPHFGIDIAAPAGSPVVAPAPGIVNLVHQDMYYTGKTVNIDHGHGLTSLLFHLGSTQVKAGQRVEMGQMIGTVGSTGRSTGPHLDWRVNLFNHRIDPQTLVGPMPRN